jgi:hypothetical protein
VVYKEQQLQLWLLKSFELAFYPTIVPPKFITGSSKDYHHQMLKDMILHTKKRVSK